MLAKILDGGELLMLSMDKVIDVVPLQRIKLKESEQNKQNEWRCKKEYMFGSVRLLYC